MVAQVGRSDDSATTNSSPAPLDPKQVFGSLVAKVRAEVRAILRSEVASGELHCADDEHRG